MKILSNKKYKDLTNKIKCLENEVETVRTELMLDNKDYELRLSNICNNLIDIVNSKMKKEKIKEKLKSMIVYIRTGK